MKKTLTIAIVMMGVIGASCLTAAAEGNAPAAAAPAAAAPKAGPRADGTPWQRTPEEMEAIRARRREKFMRRTGGWLIKREPDAGQITLVDAQKKVSSKVFDEVSAGIMRFLSIDVATVPGKFTGKGEKAHIYVIDDPEKPALVVVPEEAWATVNVAKLAGEKLEERTVKEMWRAFAFIGGAADSQMARCLMKPVFSVEDLDKCEPRTISPEPLMQMDSHLRAMGIKQFSKVTYIDALKQGWAPMPMNEYQLAIYNAYKEQKAKEKDQPQKK